LTSRGSQVRSLSRPPSSPTEPPKPSSTGNLPFLRGFSPALFGCFGLQGRPRSFGPIFNRPSLQQKIPFPAARFRRPQPGWQPGLWGVFGGQKRRLKLGPYYCGLSPRASNCRLHSAGPSRSRSTPMPRGKRPSTAALTRSGARNASEIVMLT
jgi:hypothetical protein